MKQISKIIGKFRKDEKGGVASVEFVLLAPVLILILFAILQFIILAQQTIVMRQAAYAAARSALVYECPPAGLETWWENPLGAAGNMLFDSCTPEPEKWKTAAKLALVSISPSSTKSADRQGGACAYPKALIELLDNNPVRGGLKPAVQHKACYAFEKDNVGYKLEWQTTIPGEFTGGLGGIQVKRGPPPVKITLQFRLPILAPTGRLFMSGERADGTRYRNAQVEVTLL